MEEKKKFEQQEGDNEGYEQAFMVSVGQNLDWADILYMITLPTNLRNPHLFPKLPASLRNGTLSSPVMNAIEARSIFQMEVFKLPPDINRTALNQPKNWKINDIMNLTYTCGPPVRVDTIGFPDPEGIGITIVATWQITCNITRPKPKQAKCCVSVSAYYAESIIPATLVPVDGVLLLS
ncbi:COBRA-like protein 11 [Capsicum chinense]|nr:COBRA-like protein 11 [Capsicum chinense]